MSDSAPLSAAESKSGYTQISLSYFFIFSAWATIVPFFVLYLQSLGFSGAQIGLITGISPLLSLVAKPFWAGLADATNRHRRILLGGVVAAILLNLTIPFLRTFAPIFGVQVLLSLLTTHTLPLQDSATIHMMGSNKDRYGRVRLWGTVGWGVTAAVSGLALDRLGLVSMFWLFALLMGVTLLFLRNLQFEQNPERSSYFKQVGKLVKEPQWLLFLAIVLVCGISSSAHDNYLPLLIQAMPAQSNLLPAAISGVAIVGVAVTVSTISETPVMWASHWFLRLLGSRGALYLAMAAMAVRCLLYASVETSDQILAIQVFHGLTYPMLWIAGIKFVSEMAPRGLNATAQALFSAMFMGIGTALGSYVCGWLIDRVGVQAMFRSTGNLVFACLVLFSVLTWLLSKRKPAPQPVAP